MKQKWLDLEERLEQLESTYYHFGIGTNGAKALNFLDLQLLRHCKNRSVIAGILRDSGFEVDEDIESEYTNLGGSNFNIYGNQSWGMNGFTLSEHIKYFINNNREAIIESMSDPSKTKMDIDEFIDMYLEDLFGGYLGLLTVDEQTGLDKLDRLMIERRKLFTNAAKAVARGGFDLSSLEPQYIELLIDDGDPEIKAAISRLSEKYLSELSEALREPEQLTQTQN